MSSLFLLRHAKAATALPGMRDFDRPLDARGIAEAKTIGAHMLARGYAPQQALCSAARRTRQTLDLVMEPLPFAAKTAFSEQLYSAQAPACLEAVRSFGSCPSLIVIGHNPTTEELAAMLVARGDHHAVDAVMRGFPTGGLAHFEFDGPFSDIAPHTGRLAAFLRPLEL